MTIRYDFWSLVTALADGLEHDKAPAAERAKVIVDALSKQSRTERIKREQRLGVVLEYLEAIQQELTAPDGKTVEWKK
jgi:hypothetical protein